MCSPTTTTHSLLALKCQPVKPPRSYSTKHQNSLSIYIQQMLTTTKAFLKLGPVLQRKL